MTKYNIDETDINSYLGNGFLCSCGRTHSVEIERVIIENGAIKRLPELLNAFGFKKIFIVADDNTYKVAGIQVEEVLTRNAAVFRTHIYHRQYDLVPDESAAGEFIINMERDTDVILAIGSGVINDLCKYMSYKLGIPYIIVATAPSMDGYASNGSALILENLKTTLSAVVPKAIIGDIDVLKNAPMKMITAGFGDMIGKYSAINDWQLGNIINDEYYCPKIADMVMSSVKKCIESAEGLKERRDDAIKNLMEGLVITGIAMSFAGNSRPASGSEHHLSHFVEMMYLFDEKDAPLHGAKVGVNTLIVNRMRRLLAADVPDIQEIQKRAGLFDEKKWAEEIKRIFRQAAPGIIRLNEKEKINDSNERMKRVHRIIEKWETISKVLKDTPSNEEIAASLTKAGAPVSPEELGISWDLIEEGIVYAKEVRARYTVLQLAWDIGVLDKLAAEIKAGR